MDIYLLAWVASIPGVGPKRLNELSSIFPDFSVLLSFSSEQLVAKGISPRLADSICLHRTRHTPSDIETFCRANEVTILYAEDSMYPRLLKEISDPPSVLYVKGEIPRDERPTIAVVGTRQITSYGERVTRELTTQLTQSGCVIISGFMYGVDAIAHQTCIEHGGTTIAVLGYGLGVPFYPRSHQTLAEKLLAAGSYLVTEYPPWQHAVAQNFPRRNRIVSGMSLGVVVTEAASKSGSKITANLAVEQGRDVFAVPGPMHSQFSEGTKELVNIGAKLVTSGKDVLEELGIRTQITKASFQFSAISSQNKSNYKFSSKLEEEIYTYIEENGEASLEQLVEYTTADARSLALAVSTLELSGKIRQGKNSVYSPSP